MREKKSLVTDSEDLTRQALARGRKLRIFKDNMTWMILAFGGMAFTLIFKSCMQIIVRYAILHL